MSHPARVLLSREAIVDATLAIVVEDGLERVSLRRVAGALDVTAPALYAHVRDKQDLLRAVAEMAFGELLARFEDVDESNPLDRVRAYSRVYVDFALDRPGLYRTMFLFPPDLSIGENTGRELPIATSAFDLPGRAVDEAVAAGLLSPPDADQAALTLWTSVHGVAEVLRLGFDLDDRARSALLTSVLDTVLAGLGAPPDSSQAPARPAAQSSA
jgi:AcrR family transcriptional regulator